MWCHALIHMCQRSSPHQLCFSDLALSHLCGQHVRKELNYFYGCWSEMSQRRAEQVVEQGRDRLSSQGEDGGSGSQLRLLRGYRGFSKVTRASASKKLKPSLSCRRVLAADL